MDENLDWEEFLLYVRDGRVVPVVGNELLRVDCDGRSTTIESALAGDLAAELGIDVSATAEPRLSDVAFRHLQAHGSTKRLYPKLKVALDRREFQVPAVLRKLATVSDFRLLLTTSFTPLLANALDEVRFGGRRETEVLGFAPYSKAGDLRSPALATGTCVYHLLGLASSMPDYVITEEDLIEFLHGLQSDRRPRNLFDYLRGRHLLFLGCGYANWLARFFIRTLRNERFASGNPQKSEMVIDEAASGDIDLAAFLRHYDSHVIGSMKAAEFVDQLHQRWTRSDPSSGNRPTQHVRAMPADAVFLSYAREDLVHVRSVVNALELAGIDVWFDEERLVGGADWESVIQENIQRCSLFVPFISRAAEAVTESYFRVEWRLALRRALRMAPTRPFVVPVALDDTPSDAPNVPHEFRQWQWMRLSGLSGIDTVVNLIRQNVRALRAPHYASF